MTTDVLSVRSAKTPEAVAASAGTGAGASVGVLLALAGGALAGAAVVVAGSDAPTSLYVLSVLGALWALAGFVLTVRHRCPAATLVNSIGVLTGVAAVSWAAEVASELDGAGLALSQLGQRMCPALLPALFFHMLLTLPDGHLVRRTHRQIVLFGYGVAVAAGLLSFVARNDTSVRPLFLLWPLALTSLPIAHASYRSAAVADQRRMQWIGWAAV